LLILLIVAGCTGKLTVTPIAPSGFATAKTEIDKTATALAKVQLTFPPRTLEATGTAITAMAAVPSPTPLPIDSIPAPKYDYGCVPSGAGTDEEIECITPEMTFVQKVSHVMFMEGSIDSVQLLVDTLQVVLNDDYYVWTCSLVKCSSLEFRAVNPNKIPWADMTSDQFQRLTLYVLSQPYVIIETPHAVWNGWELPMKKGVIFSTYPVKVRNYNYTEEAVQQMVDNCVGYDLVSGYTCINLTVKTGRVYFAQHSIRVTSVTNTYSTTNHLLGCGAPVVAFDKIDIGNGDWEYVQFLTSAGSNYDKPCQGG
jgi:ribosomal protein L24E